MVKSGIVLGHVVSEKGVDVNKAKIDLISKLPPLKNVHQVRSFLGPLGSIAISSKTFLKFSSLCVTF